MKFTHHVGSERETEFLTKRNRNRRRVLDNDVQIRVFQSGNNLSDIVLAGKRAGRTCCDTLSAGNAAGDIHSFVERVTDERLGTAADIVQARDRLDVFADADAPAAKDTFARVADDRRARFVDRTVVLLTCIAVAADTQFDRKGLQFAAAVPLAVEAVGRMIRQKEFKNGTARFNNALRVSFYFHAVGNRESAGRNQRALTFNLTDTHTAGSGRRKAFHVTKGRNFDLRTIQRRQKHFAGFGLNRFSVDFNINHGSYSLSCESCFCITVWRWR